MPYPRNDMRKLTLRTRELRRKIVIDLIREKPLITMNEIIRKTRLQPYHLFSNINEIYIEAGVDPIKREEKWRLKKQQQVINYIKNNNLATQREVNRACKTHVQQIFKNGIFDAYKMAGANFPYERLKLYGVGLKKIRERARNFEEAISIKLSGYGSVNRLIKTERGFADVILERKGKKAVVEIKDYHASEISRVQINQLNGYLEDLKFNLGILVCRQKPRKDRFLIGKNKIFVLDDSELWKIPKIMGT